MSTATPSSAQTSLRGNFVLLRADELHLLLPQTEVGAAAYLEQAPQPAVQAGMFVSGSDDEPALMALSKHMRPLDDYPSERFLVTPIDTPLGRFRFAWNEVKVLIDARLTVQPLPEVLVHGLAPLRDFVEMDDQVVFCCDAARLADYALAQAAQ